MSNFLLVFLGGGVGSMLRYGIARLLKNQNLDFPLATFVANVIACVILGALVATQLKKGMSNSQALFLMTGLCGGFSTFSTFTSENVQLMNEGNYITLAIYVTASILVCILSFVIGMKVIETMS